MYKYKIFLLAIMLFVTSCDEVEDDAACVDSTADLLAASAAYEEDMSLTNCQTLKTAATDFVNNGCDTTDVGDLSFITDSLDCEAMVCAMPLANLYVYGLGMEMATDSVSYCTYFDSTLIAAASLLEYNCWGEDSTEFYTAYYDSLTAAGCDWFDPVAQMPGMWQTIEYCDHEDTENCVGEINCVTVEPSLRGGFTFLYNDDDTFTTVGAQCQCEDENGNYIDGCNDDSVYYGEPDSEEECDTYGGYWNVESDDYGPVVWTDNQFSVTMDESDCDCEDENGYENQDCNWDEADEAENASECASLGGYWEEDIRTIDFSVNETADTVSFNFQDYEDAECDCEDEDGYEIQDCDWDEAYYAADQESCENDANGYWEPARYICFKVYNTKSTPME